MGNYLGSTPVLALYDPFGVDVPLNIDINHSLTRSAQCARPQGPFFADGRLHENEVAGENRAHHLLGRTLHLPHQPKPRPTLPENHYTVSHQTLT